MTRAVEDMRGVAVILILIGALAGHIGGADAAALPQPCANGFGASNCFHYSDLTQYMTPGSYINWQAPPPSVDPNWTAEETLCGPSPTLKCQDPNYAAGDFFIIVQSAFYGRKDTTTCPYSGGSWAMTNTGCNYTNALAEAKWQCNGWDVCTPIFNGGNDPCPGTYKYLQVTYRCQWKWSTTPPLLAVDVGYNRAEGCDGYSLNLTCPEDKSVMIDIKGSFYGRSNSEWCSYPDPNAMANTNCILPSSGDIIKAQCNGKKSCIPNITLDPCPGTYKWLRATWNCKPTY